MSLCDTCKRVVTCEKLCRRNGHVGYCDEFVQRAECAHHTFGRPDDDMRETAILWKRLEERAERAKNERDALRAENAKLREAAMPEWLAELLDRADAELFANANKGDWEEWQPSPDDLVSEIKHHADKLLAASDAGDSDEIKEHLADIFNYVRKGWHLALEHV